jgi:hypothetical protein
MLKTKKETMLWLNQHGVENYTINDDLTVDVNGSVDLGFEKLSEILVQFGKIEGSFWCDNNLLTNLIGSPKYTKEGFNCSNNQLINLEGCPEIIMGQFVCEKNKIKNLEFFPNKINGEIYMNENKKLNWIQKENNFNILFEQHRICNIAKNKWKLDKELKNNTDKNNTKIKI